MRKETPLAIPLGTMSRVEAMWRPAVPVVVKFLCGYMEVRKRLSK